MQDKFDVLFVLAQLGVAFAGFGAVATAFAAQRRSADTQLAATRLGIMVLTSLQVAFFALLPAALSLFAISERWLWGSSAAVVLATTALLLPPAIVRSARANRSGGASRLNWIVSLALTAGMVTASVLVLFDIPAGMGGAVYVAGQMCLLLISALQFVRVVFGILQPHAPEGSGAMAGDPAGGQGQ